MQLKRLAGITGLTAALLAAAATTASVAAARPTSRTASVPPRAPHAPHRSPPRAPRTPRRLPPRALSAHSFGRKQFSNGGVTCSRKETHHGEKAQEARASQIESEGQRLRPAPLRSEAVSREP